MPRDVSDGKNATIIPYWKVLARFGAHIFPRRDMHTCCYCETFDEAQDDFLLWVTRELKKGGAS